MFDSGGNKRVPTLFVDDFQRGERLFILLVERGANGGQLLPRQVVRIVVGGGKTRRLHIGQQ